MLNGPLDWFDSLQPPIKEAATSKARIPVDDFVMHDLILMNRFSVNENRKPRWFDKVRDHNKRTPGVSQTLSLFAHTPYQGHCVHVHTCPEPNPLTIVPHD